MANADVLAARAEATSLIQSAIDWMRSTDPSLESIDQEEVDVDINDLTALWTRAGSVLLKVGVIGSFSSGKTFLINALRGGSGASARLAAADLGPHCRAPENQADENGLPVRNSRTR